MTKIITLPLTFKQRLKKFINSENFKITLAIVLISHIFPIILFAVDLIIKHPLLQGYGIAWAINGVILFVILFVQTIRWCFDDL